MINSKHTFHQTFFLVRHFFLSNTSIFERIGKEKKIESNMILLYNRDKEKLPVSFLSFPELIGKIKRGRERKRERERELRDKDPRYIN